MTSTDFMPRSLEFSRLYAPATPASSSSTTCPNSIYPRAFVPPDLGNPFLWEALTPIPLPLQRSGVVKKLDVLNGPKTITRSGTVPPNYTGWITIDEFPTEVLELVFEFCTLLSQVPAHHGNTSTAASSSPFPITAPLLLTHICRRWRLIALRLPHIWSTITVTRIGKDANSVKLASCFLERSGSSPVDLTISLPRWIPAGRNYLDDVLRSRGSAIQFRRIYIESKFGNPQEFVTSLQGHLDRLEEVSLYAHRAYIHLDSFRSIPSLRRVALMFRHDSVSRYSVTNDLSTSLDFSQLTFLEILHEGAMDVHQLVSLLKRCENLVEGYFSLRHLPVACRLDLPSFSQTQAPTTPRSSITVLETLRHLGLSYPITVTHDLRTVINRLISFPSLEILDLHVYPATGTQHGPWCAPATFVNSPLPPWCWWSTTSPMSADPKPLDDTPDSCIPNLHGLRKLTLQGIASTSVSCHSCSTFGEDDFQNVFRSLPVLVELGVSDSLEGIDHILRGLTLSRVNGDFDFPRVVSSPTLTAIELVVRSQGNGSINTSTPSGLPITVREAMRVYSRALEPLNNRDQLMISVTLPSDDPARKAWEDFQATMCDSVQLCFPPSPRRISNPKLPIFFGEAIPDSF
ncbi:hypothetical protein BDN72DRAFT_899187 [Pluteus cervinus]|uniref:Uncharacterized protein n=1 Tax=Pluteus cervinus TaxID=181527 RepID=A0ACD3AMK9_9AGAR|nr:hypothetical protein BDN72DRAFT_899187 [Pluteus cervinus]